MTPRILHLALAAPSLLALAAAMPATAQDSPWSGWYAGLSLGGNWGDNDLGAKVTQGPGAVVIPPADVAVINQVNGGGSNKTGFTGGVEGGYNYLMGDWLLGLETDYVVLDDDQRTTHNFQSTISPATYQLNQRAKANWMWTLRPRLGYVAGPWLVYGTAGLATSNIKVDLDFSDNRLPPNTITSSDSKTKTGWAAGLGAGYALSSNLSVKGEWLYADFGSISTTAVSPGGFVGLTSEAKVRSNILRAGLDYRF